MSRMKDRKVKVMEISTGDKMNTVLKFAGEHSVSSIGSARLFVCFRLCCCCMLTAFCYQQAFVRVDVNVPALVGMPSIADVAVSSKPGIQSLFVDS